MNVDVVVCGGRWRSKLSCALAKCNVEVELDRCRLWWTMAFKVVVHVSNNATLKIELDHFYILVVVF